MQHVEIYNAKGELITLDAREKSFVASQQRLFSNPEIVNALGIEINITTLTTIQKKVVEQQFYEIKPSLYLPVRVGFGAWSTQLLTYVATSLGGDFETGIINTGGNNSRLAQADTGVDSIPVNVQTWAKEITWTIADIAFAQRAGNWDVVEAKEKSRKMNWDLGIQKIAFLGNTAGTIQGLLTLADVNINTSFITKPLKNMTDTEFQAFLAGLIPLYRTNVNYTQMPDRFYIPEADFTGLGSSVDESFPLKSRLARMLEAFQLVTDNPNFQVRPLVYCGQTNNSLGHNRYVLMKYNDENVNMNIPVDYTPTVQGTINGFQYQNVAYGQFTGAQDYRPLTILYFDWTGAIT